MSGEYDIEQVVMSLGVQSLMERQREQLKEAKAKELKETEARLKEEALEHYLLTSEDPDEQRFESLWDKQGREDALKAYEIRRGVLAQKRAREGYSF
ncbi:MAG: hypothetical protein AABN33_10950 [Acidobacteriota bacterium]